ncbi:hypothetical protein CORC01_10961 [Colletotrichum orchidophilum]|uniref:SRR1-like domain-containing protein n=1 Tax=Colletotrichum orchidophilum TaxID=1209926 RepID=A0A1G4AX71_9PEZI|nr:uncharacterized protein CORC01_10961 [Colletotrichum orchidophilum]OHE93734.1 hypothetical protein CORC01_10961 [Colletotrichum orchidophilum]
MKTQCSKDHHECFDRQERAGKIVSKKRQAGAIQTIQDLYYAGTPLFDKSVIACLDQEIARRPEHLGLLGMDRSLLEPRIGFQSIQRMINGIPPDGRMRTWGALSSYRVAYHRKHTDPFSVPNLSGTKMLWGMYQQLWKESQACSCLMAMLDELSLPRPVEKIVCFGLGALLPDICRRCDVCQQYITCKLHEAIRSRHCTQHAAALSMAQALSRTGRKIPCYSQEPEYSLECRKILGGLGITVLDGHKGFLEVDDSTLVLSISPTIPVKQIITDLARPAMIIWDVTDGDERNSGRWQLLTHGDRQVWRRYV